MNYTLLSEEKTPTAQKTSFKKEVFEGLSSNPKTLPSKFFYDDQGSQLFADITKLEEYYPTQCEYDIFVEHKESIISQIPSHEKINMIELGAGDGHKTKILLEELLRSKRDIEYIPIDISFYAIKRLLEDLAENFPELKTHGVVGEYSPGLQWVREQKPGKNVVLFLGSNLGNFPREEASIFLKEIRNSLNLHDFLFIGLDLKKEISILLKAYNDSKGLTSKFNLNLLRRINRELAADFNQEAFEHFGTYNPIKGSMESYLISLKDQKVTFKNEEKTFTFKAYEPIHTEYSWKYSAQESVDLSKQCQFGVVEHFMDPKKYFLNGLWKAL
jgi:dimethylhistidine N-methyltransferase